MWKNSAPWDHLILSKFQAVSSMCIPGVRTRVQKVKPKMAEIFVQCQSLSIVFVCAVKREAVRSGLNFVFSIQE